MLKLSKLVFKYLKRCTRVLLTFKPLHHIEYPVQRLGSLYGGWNIASIPSMYGQTAISCGAGEDISFDIELAHFYRFQVFIVDPTPRAIIHVNQALACIGNNASTNYSNLGKEEITSYNLENLSPSQLTLISKALWNKNCKVKFYPPANPEHVSHSILNIQESNSADDQSIEVDAIDFKGLLQVCSLDLPPEILKLDIEGSEHEVLSDLLESKQFPRQILVEYDELSKLTIRSLSRFHRTHNALVAHGYKLYAKERFNYSYLFCR